MGLFQYFTARNQDLFNARGNSVDTQSDQANFIKILTLADMKSIFVLLGCGVGASCVFFVLVELCLTWFMASYDVGGDCGGGGKTGLFSNLCLANVVRKCTLDRDKAISRKLS